jgi:hypothetical protein
MIMNPRPNAPEILQGRDPSVVVRSRLRGALGALAVGLVAAACPGERPIRVPPPDASAPDTARPAATSDDVAARVLCDGSGDARLVYANRGGGPSEPGFSFAGAYGHEFFVIDGTCRYWVQGHYINGIRAGTLDAAAAADIARRLHHADFASLPSNNGAPCPDASVRGLSDGSHKVFCQCTCAQDAPPPVRDVFAALAQIKQQLLQGAAADVPLRIIAVESEAQPTVTPLAWPLAWSPREVVVPLFPEPGENAGREIDAGADLTALRALRAMAAAKNVYGSIAVKTAGNEYFRVFPRDVAPPPVAAALAAFSF